MTRPVDKDRLAAAYAAARDALLAARTPQGHWVGELSTSALSTAVAVSALALVQKAGHGAHHDLIAGGLRWLAEHQNADGGWGDTVKSFSNISTTMLCRAAFHICGAAPCREGAAPCREGEACNREGEAPAEPRAITPRGPSPLSDAYRPGSAGASPSRLHASPSRHGAAPSRVSPPSAGAVLARSEAWLAARHGRTPAELAEAVRRRYGTDRTFSVPILMTSALAGLVEWREVPALPFELACLPQSWYRFLGLPVVSYALPALIAIGQAVFHHRPPWPPVRWLRRAAVGRSLRVLARIQPPNGGFLEATPLTSFVALGLASTGKAGHPVVRKCVEFIVASVRADGSWPIDTNLATWVTTLAVGALAAGGEGVDRKVELAEWLLCQQYRERHPFTGAAPGAWAWTPLPGGVPDADDTPGAILALAHLGHAGSDAVRRAAAWLAELQNRDGGVPTFCRGWGKLPFDRSGSDLTAHALRAWRVAGGHEKATRRALDYLARQQRPDGSWLPLWFGNQHAPDDINPTYGTSRVLAAYRDLGLMGCEQARQGIAYLVATQNADGGWGGAAGTPSSVEETALAVEALVRNAEAAVDRGVAWLVEAVEAGRLHEPTPIGFYFAKLWYYERMYPLVYAVAALGQAHRAWGGPPARSSRG